MTKKKRVKYVSKGQRRGIVAGVARNHKERSPPDAWDAWAKAKKATPRLRSSAAV